MRILVVDDQIRTRQSLRRLLGTVPSITEILEAADGTEALRIIREDPPQLVIMDARMPEMDGVEATRMIKESWPQVKVIVLSMYLEYEAVANKVGADAFVSKADTPEVLLEVICAQLNTDCS